jgi:hypothetical protein
MNALGCLALLFAGTLALAAATTADPVERPLQGSYVVAGATLVDAPPDEPRDTHLRLTLEGDAARELWDAMKVEPAYDECLDDGTRSKRVGEMQCWLQADDAMYRCAFAVEVATQRITSATAC